jgi:very-short-patch-repair endonuclease
MRYWKLTDPAYSWPTRLALALGQWESPMEALFWQEARKWEIFPIRRRLPGLRRQVLCGQYRLDFALIRWRFGKPAIKLAIEIDGWLYHSSPEQKARDRQRQEYCEANCEARGWQFIRFTGSEVYNDTRKCVDEVQDKLRIFGLR